MDMEKFRIGQEAVIEIPVTVELTINRMGREGADVLSTPSLLMVMERACIRASESYLDEDFTTVGYAVDALRHMAATLIGAKIRAKAKLIEIDMERGRLTYTIEVYEGEKIIGRATHKRAVISTIGS